jgi:hypothetical protein
VRRGCKGSVCGFTTCRCGLLNEANILNLDQILARLVKSCRELRALDPEGYREYFSFDSMMERARRPIGAK